MLAQLIQVASIAASFPIYSMLYILGPTTDKGSFLKKPFIKFICHSASYLFFLCNWDTFIQNRSSYTLTLAGLIR